MDQPFIELPQGQPEEDVFVFPASFAQQRLWFLDQFEPGSPFYNIPSAVHLTGDLDREVLTRCVNEIIYRHETLRTTFSTLDGQPVQVIHPELILSIPVIDLKNLPESERSSEAIRLANQEARLPFDLNKGPLIRITLLQQADLDHIILVTMHHIISDGWSIGVFIYELSMLYEAFVSGKPSPLPDLAIQYADFSEWQRNWLQGDVLEEQINYWLKALGGDVPVLELPTDRPRPPVLTSRGSAYSANLPKSILDGLKILNQQTGTTIFMTLMAAFQTLLFRYTGQADIAIGSPIANRRQAELEGLIGIFINTIVLRSNLSGDPTFRELLAQVKEMTLGTYANQDVPFEVIVDRLGLARDMSHTPLFQVMFILQNAPIHARRLPGIMIEPIEVHSGTSTFDLTLVASEMPEGINLSVEYNSDLFNSDTIERLVSHYQRLLEGILANPDLSISRLPLLFTAEWEQVVYGWNQTTDEFFTPDFPGLDRRNLTIDELFDLQVQKSPEALAVVVPGIEMSRQSGLNISRQATLSYKELDRFASLIAAALCELEIRPDQIVGVCLERTVGLIAALLGVLKAGGAYLPLDPEAPQDRLAFIISDAALLSPERPPIILTEANLVGRLPDTPSQIILLDDLLNSPGEFHRDPQDLSRLDEPKTNDRPPRSISNLVYLTYTSGSTGQSKGVMVEHRNLVNSYLAWEKTYVLHENSAHLQMANFTFDVFSGDLVRALCSGGKLVLCPRDWLLNAEQLYALMLAEQIDIAEFVPAVLRNLIQYLDKTNQRLDFMNLVACGSDSWFVSEYRKFTYFLGRHTRLINSFGLTEATIDSTYFEGSTDHLSSDQLVPIGRPFANTKIYVLDGLLQPRPIGVPGEIFVGGGGVARGYHNRAELSAERFIRNPFIETRKSDGGEWGSVPLGDRLYRTGDQARFLPDGNVEFLGRLDDQLKIRGYRIEPGEIESILSAHPMIKDAVVVAVEVSLDDKRLVAYLVPTYPYDAPTSGDLRRYVQEHLPDYMAPSVFIMIEALPLNPSGKIDRRSLAERQGIDWSERQLSNEYIPPRTPAEEILVDIWIQLLGVQKIGVLDNFFESGGHSLLATQLISRIREVFKVDLPLRNIFESPTIATLAEQIDAALQKMEGLGSGERTAGVLGIESAIHADQPLERLAREAQTGLPILPVPLSFAQQRLWFLDQLEPESAFYNLPEVFRLSGNLDERILESSLLEVIQRHESLRTTFQITNDQPIQVIQGDLPLGATGRVLERSDLSNLPIHEREGAALRIARREAEKPFNLSGGPLFRAHLIKLGTEDHLVVIIMHHIIGDNWSSNILIQEVAILYDAFSNGRPSPLPALSIQYPDYAAWQRSWLQGEVLQSQVDYWKRQLSGLPPLLELPTDRPRPPVQTFVGDFRTLTLPEILSQKIRNLSQAENATLFMTLLAAFDVLLFRYTGQEDISIGSPVANRSRAELESLIGFFVNTLVFRSNLAGQPGFRDLLRRTREMSIQAYTNQDIPFEMVVDKLQPERNLSHSPLFQVMFALQSSARTAVTLPSSGVRLAPVESHSGTSKFDLTLFMLDDGKNISGALEFNTDLFNSDTIERMLAHFEILLNSLIEHPDQPIGMLEMLSSAERHQLLVEWNQTTAPYPDSLCVHQLFENQVTETPDADALVVLVQNDDRFQESRISYKELNRRANILGNSLQSLGVGPDSLVGLCVERSVEMVVGLLGILKAGGAYVPLDPTYPQDRLQFMLRDSGARVLLTQRHLLDRLSFDEPSIGSNLDAMLTRPTILCLDDVLPTDFGNGLIGLDRPKNEAAAMAAKENLRSEVNPENLAYVIYTSGSTGLPKGAMITHRGVVNYLTWCQGAYPLQEGQGSPVHSSISFDLTVTSLLSPLMNGKRAVLLPEGLGVELLSSALRNEAQLTRPPFSLIKITPAHLQLLGEQLHPEEAVNRTRAFIIGGENLTIDHVRAWLEHAPDTALVNEYGPTETVVGCCVFWTPSESAERLLEKYRSGIIPIGRPIINTQLYILDPNMQPVPVGVSGELYIGGDGVGRGYLNRPELTAEKFVSNPFEGELVSLHKGASVYGASRLYRTGDLARYLPDGNIECLGRVDFQVKIRGFRVELGEIEAVLNQHPQVKDVVVWFWEENGIKNLAAYIVTSDGAQISASILRQYLQEKLPDYMVPGAFVFLDLLPLTVNGKVDRKALPKPDFSRQSQQIGYLAPRTPQEEITAEIFADILGLDRVGALDNFFDLGGHSLLATQVISRIRDTFLLELPLRILFEAPTPAGLAARVEEFRRLSSEIPIPPITALDRDPNTSLPLLAVPLSFSQQRLWILDQLMPGAPLYNIPTFVQVEGSLDPRILEKSLNQVIRRHEALRTVFSQTDGKPVQIVLPEFAISISQSDLTQLTEEDRQEQAMELARREALLPFDLAKGPLIRLRLVRLESKHYYILLNTHHIVSDDWSLSIFINEILVFYNLYQQAEQDIESGSLAAEDQPSFESILPKLPIQYPDFAAWQRNWLQGTVLEQQLDYWKGQLSGLPPILELPLDRPRPAVQTFNGAQVTFDLDPEQLAALKELCRQEGVTLFMTLLAAFQVLLFRYTGQEDFGIGTPIANRTRSEVEGLIGFFVNTLVMRGHMSGSPSFRTLLKRTRDVALGAYAHQDIPFEMLVDELNPTRDMSHHPLFQVMFVHQNAPRQIRTQVSDLSMAPLGLHEGIARFDITLTTVESTGLNCSLEYNRDLFDQTTIEAMADHLISLVNGIIQDPELAITHLPLLSDQEKTTILNHWVKVEGDPVPERCVFTYFEELAEQQPDAEAVVFVGPDHNISTLTYAELNDRAEFLANYLRRNGVGPEVLVGICVERSIDMVVGLLGIMKAGGAYLPLDPAYPQDRLGYMVGDSQVRILLTQEKLLARLPENARSKEKLVVCMDTNWDEIIDHHSSEPFAGSALQGAQGNNLQPDHLAYVIYTSGSTGRPKGVLLRHRGLTNLVQQQVKGFRVDAHSRVLQFASFSFDASVSEIFMALYSGGCLILAPQDSLTNIPELLQIMQEQSVTTITLPPSLLRLLDANLATQMLPTFKTLISAGETLPLDVGARWAIGRNLFNAYGPTEATIGPTYYPVQAVLSEENQEPKLNDVPDRCQTVPVGRPIPNMDVYLLDRYLQLVPIGVTGEIFLGGVGLARGYLNQPELTDEKFINNPFDSTSTSRLYRTGDLGRYLPDGNIEFLGRADFQVKVRGFRIELGEIEARLNAIPGIQTAIVIVREDRRDDRRLVAYILPESDIPENVLASEQIKGYLREHLPEYMVPSAFVTISKLPLTPNGKVDRKALPAPEAQFILSAPYQPPATEIERTLVEIWSGVIGFQPSAERPTIGIGDNFFELGGDLILSIQVAARANQAGIHLTPRQLFETPTIAQLAATTERNRADELAAGDLAKISAENEQASEGGSAVQLKDNDRFGWSDDDISDILGAIENTLDD